MRSGSLILAAAAVVCVGGGLVAARQDAPVAVGGAPTPPKLATSEDGLTLRVPAEQARQGRVYHVLSGRETQVTFTSDAPLERFEGTSDAVIGYVIVARPGTVEGGSSVPPAGDAADPAGAPGDAAGAGERGPFSIVAGEFHLAVDSLRTGIALRDRHLCGRNWLDASAHPDIVFRLARVENLELLERAEGRERWRGDIVGTMEVKGTPRELVVQGAEVAFVAESEASRAVAPGDLIRIECRYAVNLRAFGVEHSILGRKVAEEIGIEQVLYLSTVPPAPGGEGNRSGGASGGGE